MPIKLLIGADIVPTASNEKKFENASMESIVDPRLLEMLETADFRIFNLETPLTDTEFPIGKCGPNLKASSKSVNGIKALGIDFVTLANNHIMDQGSQGLESTMHILEEEGLSYAGAGHDINEASKLYIKNIKGRQIGIYCCAEHEFLIADENVPGANPFDPLESLEHIKELNNQCDYVICLYHGGKELYRYPSPQLQKVCRKIAEKGADLIVCQHSHCIGCQEHWMGSTIVYGQGNFLFDHSDSEYWQTSLLLQIIIEDTHEPSLKYIPLRKDGAGVNLEDAADSEETIKQFLSRSKEIESQHFVKENYQKFAKEDIYLLLRRIEGFSSTFIFKALDKISSGKFSSWYFNHTTLKKKRYSLINTIECEAWSELILTALKDKNS